MAISRRTFNTGPVIMPNGGRTMRDALGVTSGFRGAPDFGGVHFMGVPGSFAPNGYLNHPGTTPYGPAEDDPRDAYLDPRLGRLDPRNRAKAAQILAQQQALASAGSSATAQSLAQLQAQQRQLEMQGGGRGMPSAARGGYFNGPVRVHAGEVVEPAGDGGVQVHDPFDSQEIDRQFHDMAARLPGNQPPTAAPAPVADPRMRPTSRPSVATQESPDDMHSRLMSESDARIRAGVAAATAPPPEQGRFRDVAGHDSYSPSGRGGGGLVSHDAQMAGILDGSVHPDNASPEVRAAFMERMRADPRWARQVQGQWRDQQFPQKPVEEQQAAAAQFRAESEARMAAMTPEERAAREDRIAKLEQDSRLRSVTERSNRSRDSALRREALIADAPLEDVRANAGLEPGTSTINDVLFERARNRRAASEMGPGGTPLGAQVGRRARTEQIAAGRSLSQAQLIGAATRGTNRGDAAVDAARITAAGRIVSSADATPEARAAAQAILDGRASGTGGAPGGASGPGGGAGGPPPMGGAMATAGDEARQRVLDAFRIRVGPGQNGNPDYVFPAEQDIADLANISSPWFRADPNQISTYKGSANRVVDLVEKANSLDGEARAVAIDMLNRKLQQYGWNSVDLTNLGGDYAALVRQKRDIQEALTRMQDGVLSADDIADLRKLKSIEQTIDRRAKRATAGR